MKRVLSISFAVSVVTVSFFGCNAVLENREGTLDEAEGGELTERDAAATTDAPSTAPHADSGALDAFVPIDEDGGEDLDAALDAPADGGGPSCPAGKKLCFGECVSVSDPRYGCASDKCTPCSLSRATAVCAGGSCSVGSCNSGYANCNGNAADGCETDLSKATHCGSCNAACSGVTPLCSASGGGFSCVTGCPAQAPSRCGDTCVNLTTSVANCGQCGNACPAVANAQVSCTQGNCAFACNPGFHACNGGCVSNMDPATCGARCTPCTPPPNATPTCNVAGNCGFVCNAGFHRCGGSCVPNDAVTSCGSSCTPCVAPANGTATCEAGACGFTCNPGFHACNGSCVSDTAVTSCGGSCTPCPARANATTTCAQGACGYTCNAGFADCDLNAANGCEVVLASDANHCGNCTTVCPGTACVSGLCAAAPPPDAGGD